ncbi:Murein hydrolase activator NlpD [Candidatus Moranella endobia PCVAL]|nr:Murein hydrolase activator NlpD [Candidatus Moranella endobia PCVAL]
MVPITCNNTTDGKLMTSVPTLIVNFQPCKSDNDHLSSISEISLRSSNNNAPGVVLSSTPIELGSVSTPISDWYWPTDGKIIKNFSAAEVGNKGIDIAGFLGQAILATSNGRVVYAGNAWRGYGNLIIIKHNDNYLSAYAHNNTMLVCEKQTVSSGQKIATMGSTGTNTIKLYFEIRYKSKSVNPLCYLPQR